MIEVDLANDLVNTVHPGDDITLTGIVDVRIRQQSKQIGVKKGAQIGLHSYMINAIAIVNNKQPRKDDENLDFTPHELEMFKTFASDTNIFRILVQSLCPRIYENEMVKAGLILSLFGASGNVANETTTTANTPNVVKPDICRKRSEIHVLVVGDPGLGKSLLIQSCSNIAPRGVFVCGSRYEFE